MADDIKSKNIYWHEGDIKTDDRERQNEHKGAVVWFTGLSGSGKSTVAQAVQSVLFEQGARAYVLDGDNIRHGLNKDLGFSPEDRVENIRRIGEVANLFTDAAVVTLTAFISPYREDRDKAREIAAEGRFFEVFVECDLDICEERDPKGLYKKARAGEIPQFTGISAPYEAPEKAELVINTGKETLEESCEKVLAMLRENGIIS
jgi:adenylylsulfate kinase